MIRPCLLSEGTVTPGCTWHPPRDARVYNDGACVVDCSQSAAVCIVISPMRRAHKRLYRVTVKCTVPGVALFGPLFGDMVVSEPVLASLVRETVINADAALREQRFVHADVPQSHHLISAASDHEV